MELSLEDPLRIAVLGNTAAVLVNVPRPERYALHKLLVATERPAAQAGKARKDLAQAMLMMNYLIQNDADALQASWSDVCSRGPNWRSSLKQGLKRLEAEFGGAMKSLRSLGWVDGSGRPSDNSGRSGTDS